MKTFVGIAGLSRYWSSTLSVFLIAGATTFIMQPQESAQAAPVNVTFKWKSISAGGTHTCGIAFDDRALCWGSNTYGQIGNATTTRAVLPTYVAGGLSFAQVAAGSQHTCGIALPNRDVYCWGRNHKRQLASGGSSNSSVPVRVASGIQATSISTDGDHTCAVTGASEVWCWGSNEQHNIGNGQGGDSFQYQSTPVREGLRLQFSQVSAGWSHTCATTTAAQGYCWGTNAYAQSTGAFTNTQLSLPTGLGGRQWYQIVAGEDISCGIGRGMDDRQVLCWGRATYGAMGNGLTTGSISASAHGISSPIPAIPFSTISAGGYSVCGIATNGELYCWGGIVVNNSGGFRSYSSPIPLAAGVMFESVDVGADHHCAISTEKDAYCWGNNGDGQLGTGSTTASEFPADKARVTTATTVATTVAPQTVTTLRTATTTTTSIPSATRASTGKPGSPCDREGQVARWKKRQTTCRGGVWR